MKEEKLNQEKSGFEMDAIILNKTATKKRRPITRENKKEKTKAAIIMAALDLSERQGFEKTAVDEIAAAAEVSTRTFYRYFPIKEHVIFPYHDEYVARFRSLLERHRAKESPLEIVQRALRSMAELYLSNREEHLRFQRIISSSPTLVARSVPFDEEWEAAIAAVWRNGQHTNARKKQEASLIAGAVMGVINAVMSMWYAADCPADLVARGERVLDLLERGIGNGMKRLSVEPNADKRFSERGMKQ